MFCPSCKGLDVVSQYTLALNVAQKWSFLIPRSMPLRFWEAQLLQILNWTAASVSCLLHLSAEHLIYTVYSVSLTYFDTHHEGQITSTKKWNATSIIMWKKLPVFVTVRKTSWSGLWSINASNNFDRLVINVFYKAKCKRCLRYAKIGKCVATL